MSDPSFSDTLTFVKNQNRKSTAVERDWWNNAGSAQRTSILENLDLKDIGTQLYETATENAYQQDHEAKINQLVETHYDSLPEVVKATITETLINNGELPDPSVYRGIGQEFAINKEVWHECDRCDESFMDEEDFILHGEVDHGDSSELSVEAEESFEFSMNPEVSRYALHEAKKALQNKKSYLDKYVPDETIKTTVGYNDNPNEGLYDTKKFKNGTSEDRVALEAMGGAPEIFSHMVVSDPSNRDQPFSARCDHCGFTTDSVYPNMKNHLKSDHGIIVENYNGEADNYPQKKGDVNWDEDFEEIKKQYQHTGEADNYPQNKKNDDWEDDFKQLKSDYQGRGTDVVYDKEGLSDISMVGQDKEPAIIESLEGIDFSEEAIDFDHYPTKAVEGLQKQYYTDVIAEVNNEYENFGATESENEIVESQITNRKMQGYQAEAIANELRITYGVSYEDAISKVNSVEVSVNDNIANTFFQKKYSECTESEKQELALYSGNDTQ